MRLFFSPKKKTEITVFATEKNYQGTKIYFCSFFFAVLEFKPLVFRFGRKGEIINRIETVNLEKNNWSTNFLDGPK